MKTLAELKREASTGEYEGLMIKRFGESVIPARLQGWRKIVGCNTVSIFFQNVGGDVSELPLPKASLVDYDGETLTVYSAGYRDLTPEERAVKEQWSAHASTEDYIRRSDYDALTDGSSTYWEEVRFFKDAGYEYLMGAKKERGMIFDTCRQQVRDERIKGDITLQYKIRKAA